MGTSVIAISRAYGAGGEEIGASVAKQLGFRLVDNEIISKAAELAGATPEEVERVENRQPLIARLLERMATVTADPVGGAPLLVPPAITNERYERFIVDVIRQTAEQGNVVILAHAASIPLAGMDNLLRVLVTGSPDVRTVRLMARDGTDRNRAEHLVKEGDKAREDYFRRFFNLKEELPTHYDLVINTDYLSIDRAAAVVTAAANA